MNALPKKTKNSKKVLMPLGPAIIALMLCAHGCATPSRTNDALLPPLPDQRVLAELDAHNLTPDSAPQTWNFLGRLFRYYDIVKAMSQ